MLPLLVSMQFLTYEFLPHLVLLLLPLIMLDKLVLQLFPQFRELLLLLLLLLQVALHYVHGSSRCLLILSQRTVLLLLLLSVLMLLPLNQPVLQFPQFSELLLPLLMVAVHYVHATGRLLHSVSRPSVDCNCKPSA